MSSPVLFAKEGIAGDRQADTRHHGGRDKAVCVYPAAHIDAWSQELGGSTEAARPGGFGENLTVEGLDEATVSIGDRFLAHSGLVLEVSQPRVPCWKLARRWGLADMTTRVVESGRTGWYCRVITPGVMEEGETLARVGQPHAAWTVERSNVVYHASEHGQDAMDLAEVPPLSADTRAALYRRLQKSGYVPMACAVHDLLEDAAVRGVPLDLQLGLISGDSETYRARVRDLRTENGAEYVELDSSRLVRLDRILSVDPVVDVRK